MMTFERAAQFLDQAVLFCLASPVRDHCCSVKSCDSLGLRCAENNTCPSAFLSSEFLSVHRGRIVRAIRGDRGYVKTARLSLLMAFAMLQTASFPSSSPEITFSISFQSLLHNQHHGGPAKSGIDSCFFHVEGASHAGRKRRHL